ncbi:MAG: hypothetical protein ACYTDV_21550, partial [Planctomycetota bacterium]
MTRFGNANFIGIENKACPGAEDTGTVADNLPTKNAFAAPVYRLKEDSLMTLPECSVYIDPEKPPAIS